MIVVNKDYQNVQ